MRPDIADWPMMIAAPGPRLAGEAVPSRHGIALAAHLDAQAEHHETEATAPGSALARIAKAVAGAMTSALPPRPAVGRRAGYTLRV